MSADDHRPVGVIVHPNYLHIRSNYLLADFSTWLRQVQAAIPADCLGAATLQIEGDSDDGYVLTIKYERPPTDDDIAARKARQLANDVAKEQHERRTLAALKAKYELGT